MRKSWADHLDDTLRGMASGFLVGIPTVFTVDSWWLGEQLGPLDAIWLLVFSFCLTWHAVYWSGFHQTQRNGIDHATDAFRALAIASLSLIVIFAARGQIEDSQPGAVALGRIAAALVAMDPGFASANNQL